MPIRPAYLIGGLLAAGGVAAGVAFAMGGDDETPSGPRGPWTDPVVPPQTPEEILAVKQVICTCFRGGATELEKLTLCTLKQVYDEVPWPAQAGDHASLASVTNTVRLTAADLLKQPNAAAREAWCAGDKPVPGVVVDPPPPPTPGGGTDITPWVGTKPGQLVRISKQVDSQVEIVARAFGIQQNSKNVERALWCMNLCGFNLYFYSRPHTSASYGAVKVNGRWYNISPAFYTWNENLIVAAAQAKKPHRQVSWNGTMLHNIGYGQPFVPEMDMIDGELHCRGADAWAPERNPPKSVLDALQLDLGQMRVAWEAGQVGL